MGCHLNFWTVQLSYTEQSDLKNTKRTTRSLKESQNSILGTRTRSPGENSSQMLLLVELSTSRNEDKLLVVRVAEHTLLQSSCMIEINAEKSLQIKSVTAKETS